ncbi:heat shock protein HtpX [Thalassoglobus neptunius]|uniref:Heat shock protein HtpX n=1 Tax=Thalassoglobus neptunius TaxID=1938619 RepID=A0A5C5VXF6_9PLAN|nr:M48 family metallopeptidase [Thalassoglobus neptunius]TWT42817.1 heat shock protein HtpX [Thalassoglobus neptunius]
MKILPNAFRVLRHRRLSAVAVFISFFLVTSSCLIADDFDDPAWEVLSDAAQLQEDGEPEQSISLLESLLSTPNLDPSIERSTRYYLVTLYSSTGDDSRALKQIDRLLKHEEDTGVKVWLLLEQAKCYENRGEFELADRAREQVGKIQDGSALTIQLLPETNFLSFLGAGTMESWVEDQMENRLTFGLALMGACVLWFAAVFGLNTWIGNRQRIEGKGTWRELLIAAFGLAILQVLPFLVGMGIFWQFGNDINYLRVLGTTVVSSILAVLWSSLYLLPPTRWVGSTEAMPIIEDAEFQQRLKEISTDMEIEAPIARLIPTPNGNLAFQGFAGGLPKPSLTISDGILMRLSGEERDAIVAHELGHIASGSLWYYPATVCLCWALAVISSTWWGFLSAMLFMMAVYMGLGRVISRYFEFDSDRRAAKIVGPEASISALDKIHHGSMLRNTGWASFLAYSMATHPSHEERLQAISNETELDDHPTVSWSERTARLRRNGARIAFACWIAVMVIVTMLPLTGIGSIVRAMVLLAVVLTPIMTLNLALRKDVKAEHRRKQNVPGRKGKWSAIQLILICALGVGGLMLFQESSDDFSISPNLIICAIVLYFGYLAFATWKGKRSTASKIRLAMHQRRWDDAIALGEKSSKAIRDDAALRHDLILARWMSGGKEESISEMSELRSQFPKFKHPWVTQSMMYLDRGEFDRALELLDEVRDDLRKDVSPKAIAARCYRLQGKIELVDKAARQIEQLMPDSPSVFALDCAVAIDRDAPELAREKWKEANRLAPGDAFLTLLQAELEYRFGDPKLAAETLVEAKKRINAATYSFLSAETQHVEKIAKEVEEKPSTSLADPEESGEVLTSDSANWYDESQESE